MSQPIKTLGLIVLGFAAGLIVALFVSGSSGSDGIAVEFDGDRALISPARSGTAVIGFGAVSPQNGALQISDGRSFMVADLWVRNGKDTIPCYPHASDELIPGCIPVPPPLPLMICVIDEKDTKRCFGYDPPRPLPIGPGPTPATTLG